MSETWASVGAEDALGPGGGAVIIPCAWPPDEIDALLDDHEDDAPEEDSRAMIVYRRGWRP